MISIDIMRMIAPFKEGVETTKARVEKTAFKIIQRVQFFCVRLMSVKFSRGKQDTDKNLTLSAVSLTQINKLHP